MAINNNYTTITRIVNHINNPAATAGVLIEEIPTDIGRSWRGYKRGGIIEAGEKIRKELMGAVVWIFGIPAFNKLGNKICENIYKIPTNIDYSNAKEGNDAIKNSVEFLTKGVLKNNDLDVSELKKYGDKFKGLNSEQLIKKVRISKQITSIAALILNCIAMGFILPKINQAITRKKLAQQEKPASLVKISSMDEFMAKTKPKNNEKPSFKGIASFSDLTSKITYGVENNNTFRLIATDVPMVGGRVLTSRNRFEGFENFLIDVGSIFFYNFTTKLAEKGLRKISKTPEINPVAAEIIANANDDILKKAFCNLENNPKNLSELFNNKELEKLIYKEATHGKYGKINKFIKNSDLKKIDENVINFVSSIKNECKGKINRDTINRICKTTNKKNAAFLAAGLAVSIAGLAYIVPKSTYALMRKITGRNTFTGITNFDEDKDKK